MKPARTTPLKRESKLFLVSSQPKYLKESKERKNWSSKGSSPTAQEKMAEKEWLVRDEMLTGEEHLTKKEGKE